MKKARHINALSCLREAPTLETEHLDTILDAALLESILEYLKGVVTLDGDPLTLLDCSRDDFRGAA